MKDVFVKEWIKRAEQENEGSVFQFVSYYIAFNYLYNESASLDCGNLSEKKLLKKYIVSVAEKYNFNPYKSLSADSELLKGVHQEKSNKETDKTKLQDEDIEELFTGIYYVRCNLFHGSKSMYNERNCRLISDSCKVLCSLFNILNER